MKHTIIGLMEWLSITFCWLNYIWWWVGVFRINLAVHFFQFTLISAVKANYVFLHSIVGLCSTFCMIFYKEYFADWLYAWVTVYENYVLDMQVLYHHWPRHRMMYLLLQRLYYVWIYLIFYKQRIVSFFIYEYIHWRDMKTLNTCFEILV